MLEDGTSGKLSPTWSVHVFVAEVGVTVSSTVASQCVAGRAPVIVTE
jgi:hypothetical protein